jgi:pSer/pThr/pTyr-binding forkhead associated (FHA) protein
MPLKGDVTDSGKQLLRIGGSNGKPTIIGCRVYDAVDGNAVVICVPEVAEQHARIEAVDGVFFLTDLCSKLGTWITSVDGGRYKLTPKMPVRLRPADVIEFGCHPEAVFRVKLRKSSA